ncbi:hypothetical protein CEE44_03175 [Candidatus Woesearchaeota archaeon B3_Woes]|nr:MAG: hypothetical protein CEE44_03175 [Candidatus Woesearchaeota archaeon B3_Woes]
MSKEPLYIFIHVQKCAGTTIRKHIEINLKKDNYLLLTIRGKPVFERTKENTENYLRSLNKKQKDKIKIIFGHGAYYNLHKFFPDRKARYITFLRNPVDRTISQYNFNRQFLKQKIEEDIRKLKNKLNPEEFKIIKKVKLDIHRQKNKELIKNGRVLNFKKWFLANTYLTEEFIYKFFSIHILNIPLSTHMFYLSLSKRIQKKDINKKNLEKIKKTLNKFYFIGLTENPKDFLYLYLLLGISKFSENKNISKKYFNPKNKEKIERFILTKNKYDLELYNHAKKLNKQHKKQNPKYKLITTIMATKGTLYNIKTQTLSKIQQTTQLLFKISSKLKKKSKTYNKLIKTMKNEK